MKRILYFFLMLFVGINTAGYAQQEASTVTEWDGSSKRLRMKPDSLITFSYKAAENGTFYIYADDQDVYDNVPVNIWGGWYHDGAYDPDSPLQEAGPYENGVGVYGWIKVFAGDEIRFTLSTPKDAAGAMAIFSIKSLLYNESVKGDSWERPIALTQGTKTNLPVYRSYDPDYLADLSYATFCRFVAPSDGVASILTGEYLIYYIEEGLYGSIDEPLKYASQDISTNDHEFVVKKDSAYIVIVPNSRPTDVTFKMNSSRPGENCKDPIELTGFPATLDLVKGNNFYRMDLAAIGEKQMMDLAVAAGWKGTITYLNNCDYESDELLPADIKGTAVNYTHNLDPLYMGSELIINFYVTDVATANDAVTLDLREPKEGESFGKAMPVKIGENAFSGTARDYWFVYTADKDAEISVATTGTLKHMLYSRDGGNIINEYNVYRLNEGQSIYLCISTATEGNHTVTLTEKAIEAGDYCDMPIVFNLGEDVVIKDRGDDVMNYRQFTAEKSGFAVFETTAKNVLEYYWTIYFRQECGGKAISYTREETTDAEGNITARSYKIPVSGGYSYIFEIMSFANDGADVIFTTRFEEANEGDVCATAVEIKALNDTIKLDYTFDAEKWYKLTAEKSGFYLVNAKLGQAANMKTKVGDCDAAETNAGNDNSQPNAYMGGYKAAKVYVEEGQTLYIYTKTGSSNDEAEFSPNFYFIVNYAEPRPGEDVAVAIEAQAGTEYAVMTNDEGYEQWYVYTIPAGKELTAKLTATKKFISNSLSFYKEDKVTSMSAYKGDFTQNNLTNEAGEVIGKEYLFDAAEAQRTIYIKVSTVNAMYSPVVWQIVGEGNDIEDIIAPQHEEVIYDLMGRRVAVPTKGIYIINGVKRVIK